MIYKGETAVRRLEHAILVLLFRYATERKEDPTETLSKDLSLLEVIPPQYAVTRELLRLVFAHNTSRPQDTQRNDGPQYGPQDSQRGPQDNQRDDGPQYAPQVSQRHNDPKQYNAGPPCCCDAGRRRDGAGTTQHINPHDVRLGGSDIQLFILNRDSPVFAQKLPLSVGFDDFQILFCPNDPRFRDTPLALFVGSIHDAMADSLSRWKSKAVSGLHFNLFVASQPADGRPRENEWTLFHPVTRGGARAPRPRPAPASCG